MIERIKGIFLQEYYIMIGSLETIIDIFWYPIMSVLSFAFVSRYFAGSIGESQANFFIIGYVMWEILRIAQYSVSLGAMWNVWSRNLTNLFITPLSMDEYILAQFISALFKAGVVFFLNNIVLIFIFHINIPVLFGFANLLLYFVNLVIFAWTIGIMILGIVFMYGMRLQAVTWGLIYFIQPITAAFYPVSVLPVWLQKIAFMLPPTYIFEAGRVNLLGDTSVQWGYIVPSFGLNLVYVAISMMVFRYFYTRSLRSGQFARLES